MTVTAQASLQGDGGANFEVSTRCNCSGIQFLGVNHPQVAIVNSSEFMISGVLFWLQQTDDWECRPHLLQGSVSVGVHQVPCSIILKCQETPPRLVDRWTGSKGWASSVAATGLCPAN